MSVAMEDSAAKDQSSASGRSASRLLRYPLRSSTKSKEDKPPLVDSSNTHSATKRGKVSSTVSKSVSVLDLSGKDKSASAKPPRRLSVPNKSNASPAPKPVGNVTPVSEARAKRSAANQGKSVTPVSDISKSSSTRKKFSTLYSASYWLSQIKHSESAAKHSISLGFFKLALEAGCEPIQRMSDELKLYIRRHDLTELGEFVKELFEGYKISENFEPSQSENGSQVPSEGNQLSDDDVKSSSSSITDAEKLKPKSLDLNVGETQKVKKENSEKVDSVKKTIGRSVPKKAASSNKSGSEVKGRSAQKKPQKQVKQESAQDKDKVKKMKGKKSASEEG
ncbi:hypothetical protein PHJA_002079700 [Phtheirospermum japonicum]|uniref:Uncharacterized protein n=1 Tax=Phtheirospermum japonicum TaxID=374723 RepID=A0A830CJ77_9LAMI|nr:hypothetical protein PHJA_002079700 [Phtheirospermum japonicum]